MPRVLQRRIQKQTKRKMIWRTGRRNNFVRLLKRSMGKRRIKRRQLIRSVTSLSKLLKRKSKWTSWYIVYWDVDRLTQILHYVFAAAWSVNLSAQKYLSGHWTTRRPSKLSIIPLFHKWRFTQQCLGIDTNTPYLWQAWRIFQYSVIFPIFEWCKIKTASRKQIVMDSKTTSIHIEFWILAMMVINANHFFVALNFWLLLF